MRGLTASLCLLGLFLAACAPVPTREPPEQQAPATAPESGDRSSGPEAEATPATPAGRETTAPEPADADDPVPGKSATTRSEPAPASTAQQPEATSPQDAQTRQGEPPGLAAEAKGEPAAAAQGTETARPEPSEGPAERPDMAVSGRVVLTGGDAEPEEAVVYFVPRAADAKPSGPAAAPAHEIVTRDKTLRPTVLAVPRGAVVRFPNEDPILHNLFSVSAENRFDLGVYGPGESPSVTFDQPGVVNIYCNVHHDMHAHVLVIDTPWHTRPDSAGNFRLEGLPAGPGELHVWHRQSERWSRPLDLPAAAPFDIALEVSRPKLPPHRDKTGQSYNRRDRDPYR